MEVRNIECEGCNEVKRIPMIQIEEASDPLHGLCAECVETHGMQVGQRLRLRRPGHDDETEVLFVSPTENAVWVRYSDGTTERVSWPDFDKVTDSELGAI